MVAELPATLEGAPAIPPRPLYPLMLTPAIFKGRKALVVGGGKVAGRKVKGLLALETASVRLIAPALTPELQNLAGAGRLEWLEREWQPGDVTACPEALLVFAATSSGEVNRAVALE